MGQLAQIVAAFRQDIERTELHLVVTLARVQRVEVGDAVDTEDDGLAVDHEALASVLERGFHDPGIAPRPVMAVPGKQPDVIAIAVNEPPVSRRVFFATGIATGLRNISAN
jgi:hypothetical protein